MVDARAFGLVGPTGPAGPSGPTGAAGPGMPFGSTGIACQTRCLNGDRDFTYSCGDTTGTCTSPDGQYPIHAIVVDCGSTGVLALPFCVATSCDPGQCPGELFDTSDAATDARRAAAADDVYYQEHRQYFGGACRNLPGFASSSGAICAMTFKICAGGADGYTISTVDRTQTNCIWDSCPADGVRLRCSPPS